MDTWWKVLTRRKVLSHEANAESKLGRVLNVVDLTALGVGSTLGVGVYVLAGHVARDIAGPAVIVSFAIAAAASLLAGLCYAEFGARAPRAGSAYTYTYICIGELVAFIIGWNLILEYIIGAASVCRGLSLYLDSLLNNTLKDTFRDVAPMDSSLFSPYFDFLSFGLAVVLAIALAFGLKESTVINNILTFVNLLVVMTVIVCGAIKADPENWKWKGAELPQVLGAGSGGFFPFGAAGVIKGAATCFYGFVGFDCIATTGEEVKNPKRAIPVSIIISLTVVFLSYFGTSTVLTLMWPYFLQDRDAPLPHAFEAVDWDVVKWIVAIGGIFGLSASLYGAMFPLPRIIYAMASDGLIFRFLGEVNSNFQTPVVGTLFAGILTGIMAAVFELKHLVSMMSIGTLMAYSIVAACVLLLRYAADEDDAHSYELLHSSDSETDILVYTDDRGFHEDYADDKYELNLISPKTRATCTEIIKQVFTGGKEKSPTSLSQKVVVVETCIFALLALALGLFFTLGIDEVAAQDLWIVVLTSVIGGIMLLILLSIYIQPTSKKTLPFKVCLVPLLPALSICINIYLMLMLDPNTWIRFGIWMVAGIPIYIACTRLYKQTAPKSKAFGQNGYINDGFETEKKNGNLLNVPAIIVQSPTPTGTLKQEDDVGSNKINLYENEESVNIYEADKEDAVIQKKAVFEALQDDENDVYEEYETNENYEGYDGGFGRTDSFERVLNYEDDEPKTEETHSMKSSESALAILDEVLKTEDERHTPVLIEDDDDDDVPPSFNVYSPDVPKPRDRRISADTESVASNTPVEHSVVAIVHREDECSVPASPLTHALPPIVDVVVLSDDTNSNHETDVDSLTDTEEEKEKKEADVNAENEPKIEGKQLINENDDKQLIEESEDEPDKNKTTEEEKPLPVEEEKPLPVEEGKPPPVEEEKPFIPPPPSMDDFILHSRNTLPKLNIHPGEIPMQSATLSAAILHPTPRKKSIAAVKEDDSEGEGLDDNITFGSKSHAEIRKKLNVIFQQPNTQYPMYPMNPTKGLMKPALYESTEENNNEHEEIEKPMNLLSQINKEITDFIPNDEEKEREGVTRKPSDIKKRLNEILATPQQNRYSVTRASTINYERRPENISRSTSPPKPDAHKANEEPLKKDTKNDENDKLKHTTMMADTFRHIRLRKTPHSSILSEDTFNDKTAQETM